MLLVLFVLALPHTGVSADALLQDHSNQQITDEFAGMATGFAAAPKVAANEKEPSNAVLFVVPPGTAFSSVGGAATVKVPACTPLTSHIIRCQQATCSL
jgi:hypothetical protein